MLLFHSIQKFIHILHTIVLFCIYVTFQEIWYFYHKESTKKVLSITVNQVLLQIVSYLFNVIVAVVLW